MRLFNACLVLVPLVGYSAASAIDISNFADAVYDEDANFLVPFENRGGWVNPEDLTSMPQCIAQQDRSAWLSAMTKCTSKRCIRHFGIICTRHQWLTELSCLNNEISSDVLEQYLPYCSRSVLAKAQLYQWFYNNLGRTWFVDPGDAYDAHHLTEASLRKGYATVDQIDKAPRCLVESESRLSSESFQHIMASCGFKETAYHTGNMVRPWEYNEGLHSMTALDSETVGYDLIKRNLYDRIRWPLYATNYFDKKCFCDEFVASFNHEPCSETHTLDLTKERLWINAICGSMYLPRNWKVGLKITEFAYIDVRNWHWPTCVSDMPEHTTAAESHCMTDACHVGDDGYCQVVRAVDRACFCRNIDYDSCGGSCHIFESRINYVKWLHDLCGKVPGWHGLPNNWRWLAAPMLIDMIPWTWTVKPSQNSNNTFDSYPQPIETVQTCPSTQRKLWSLALVNLATFLMAHLTRRKSLQRFIRLSSLESQPRHWSFNGALIASLHVLANYINAMIIQNIPGYENISIVTLILLWCTMPRITGLVTLLIRSHSLQRLKSAIASFLIAEAILQMMGSLYFILTVGYGLEHGFYSGWLGTADGAMEASMMYAGALIWLIAIMVLFVITLQHACRTPPRATKTPSASLPVRMWDNETQGSAWGLMVSFNFLWASLEDNVAQHFTNASKASPSPLLIIREGRSYIGYGTLPTQNKPDKEACRGPFVRVFTLALMCMGVLCFAQCLFWIGFIGLALDEFCLPRLELLTAVWVAFSWACVLVGAGAI